jgi:UDP-sulfoquinovose synthase
MNIAILGADGYIGFNLMMYLANRGHDVVGMDNYSRRLLVNEVGGNSLTPIRDPPQRVAAFHERFGVTLKLGFGEMMSFDTLKLWLKNNEPDAIVHLAEQPSAPFSMMDAHRANRTQQVNVIGTLNLLWAMKEACPKAHLIKLGTLGEYGMPNVDIPEGYFEIEYKGRKDRLPFPMQPGSFYHITKAQDTLNIAFACKTWDLCSTDLMQGPVYGAKTQESRADERLLSRLDYDAVFGTVINRYVAQAVAGHPLTPYGSGGQTRGFIYIEDTLRCIEVCIEKPPEPGEHRVFNQFFELYSVLDLAKKVKEICGKRGIDVEVKPIDNPRVEAEKHHYNPSNEGLLNLGVKPHLLDAMLPVFIDDVIPYKDRINPDCILPRVTWK